MIKLKNLLMENDLPFEKQDGKYIGYRGVNSPSQRKPDLFGTEGIGLYVATSVDDASFFGDVYVVVFDPPKKIVTAKVLPLFRMDDDDEAYEAIVGKLNATDDDWIKAHKIAAQHLKLKGWSDVNKAADGDLQRTFTQILLKWGYDAVWTGDWIVLLDTHLCKSMTPLDADTNR